MGTVQHRALDSEAELVHDLIFVLAETTNSIQLYTRLGTPGEQAEFFNNILVSCGHAQHWVSA